MAALLTGLAGSLHCVGMCGPLAVALPVGRLPVPQRMPARWLYNAGRVAAYSMLGAVAGSLGQGLLLTGLQRPVSMAAGLLLLVWLGLGHLVPVRWQMAPLVRWLTAPLTRLLRQPTLGQFTGLGFLNGLLPCGSVYIALVGSLTMPTPLGGAAYLFTFGVGTLPAMLSIQLITSRLTPVLRRRFQRALPVATAFIALLLIGRGLLGLGAENPAPGAIPLCHGTLTGR